MKHFFHIILLLGISVILSYSCSKDAPKSNGLLVSYSNIEELTVDQFLNHIGQEMGFDIPENYRAMIPDKTLNFDKIVYESVGGNCSALVVYDKEESPKSLLLGLSHTIGKSDKAPTESFLVGEVLMAYLGYYVVIPDYIGFGESSDRIHPYLHVESTAKDAINAVKACREYLLSKMNLDVGNSLYVSGYSEGGGNALGFQKVAERDEAENIHIVKVYCGSGPYDIFSTFNSVIEQNYNNFPYGIAMIPLGLSAGDGLTLDYSKIFTGKLADNYQEWILSKKYTPDEVNTFIGSDVLSDFLHPDFFTKEGNSEITKLIVSLKNNSLIDGWTPIAPIRMMHGTTDDYVPFLNAENAYNTFKAKGCDIILLQKENMGHIEVLLPFLFNEYLNLSVN